MEISKQTEQSIAEFYRHLGQRFKEVEVASEGAPITVCARDNEDKEYWIRLVNNLNTSVETRLHTGTTIENVVFYGLYSLVSNDQNVFHMELFNDGYILWYINDLTPEQMRVTDEEVAIGVTSALHVQTNSGSSGKIDTPIQIEGSSYFNKI